MKIVIKSILKPLILFGVSLFTNAVLHKVLLEYNNILLFVNPRKYFNYPCTSSYYYFTFLFIISILYRGSFQDLG